MVTWTFFGTEPYVDESTILFKYFEKYHNRILREIVWYSWNYPSEHMNQSDTEAFETGLAQGFEPVNKVLTQAIVQSDPGSEYDSDRAGWIIKEEVLYNLILEDALRYNRFRKVNVLHQITGTGTDINGDSIGTTTVFDETNVSYLTPEYSLPINPPLPGGFSGNFTLSQLVEDDDYEAFYNYLFSGYEAVRDNIVSFTRIECHSSCHSNCHGSRGRR